MIKNKRRKKLNARSSLNISFFKSLTMSTKIAIEFFKGFLFISKIKKAVTFFGSARESMPRHYYEESEELAAILSKKGFTILTGGGEGIMGSSSRGAHRVGGDSIGININLPYEQKLNNFLTKSKTFKYFFSRKMILSCSSEIYIFFPGGYGTLDELFDILTAIQTNHSEYVPVILYGEDYWNPLMKFINETLYEKFKSIDEKDAKLPVVINSVNETERYIESLGVIKQRTCKLKGI